MSDHGLWLDDLDLAGGSIADAEFTLHALAEGTNWGSSEAQVTVALSMLADGSRVVYDGEGNRTIPIRVKVQAPNPLGLAQGEAALAQRMRREVPLIWQPPRSWSEVRTVFDVRMSSMSFEFDDQAELRGERVYKIELTCAPWARSENLTRTEAAPVPSTVTTALVDDCTTTAPWTGYHTALGGYSSPVAATSWAGGQAVAHTPGPAGVVVYLQRTWTTPVDFTGTPYLIVIAESIWSTPEGWDARINEASQQPISVVKLGNNAFRLVFKMPAGMTSLTSFRLMRMSMHKFFGTPAGMAIYEITRSSSPGGDTPRQRTHIFEVGGTERTSGKIEVSGGDQMGLTLVHTSPYAPESVGYTPGCRNYRIDGNGETAAPLNISGIQEAIHPDPVIFDRPNDTLPEGSYVIAALLYAAAGPARIYWTIGDLDQGFVDHEFSGGDDLVPLTVARLPVIRSTSQIDVTRVEIQRDVTSSKDVYLDDVLLFWMGKNCGLTVCADTEPRLTINSNPVTGDPEYWTGTADDGADRRHPGRRLIVPGSHSLAAGQMRVWTGTRGVTNPRIVAEFYKRWHTHAAE